MVDGMQTKVKRHTRGFQAPLHVLLMGCAAAVCLYCTGKAFALRIMSGLPSESLDAKSLFLLAMVFGCLSECVGAAYLYRCRKHGTRKKAGAMFIIVAMVSMLLPIQFSAMSVFLSHTAR